MQRSIYVTNGVVTSDTAIIEPPAENLFTDPLHVFGVGDAFSTDRYETAYGAITTDTEYAQDSIFIVPAHLSNKQVFASAGVTPNIQPHKKSKYVFLATETASLVSDVTSYGQYHGVQTPNYVLVDKATAQQEFINAGFSVLVTATVRTMADIEALPFNQIILKPAIAVNGAAPGHPLATILYTIKTKADLLSALDVAGAFGNLNLLTDTPLIAQQVADSSDSNFNALILSGAVNGAGDIWHFSPIELATQYDDAGRKAKTIWSAENNTAETLQLQQCVAHLLANVGSVNCFYHIQFLKSGDKWVPHDFQYRLTYFGNFALEQLGFSQHKEAIIRFAFDRTDQKPEQPADFGMSLIAPRTMPDIKKFVSGATKAEIVAALAKL